MGHITDEAMQNAIRQWLSRRREIFTWGTTCSCLKVAKDCRKSSRLRLKDVGPVAQSVATDYELDGLGSNPGGYENFRPSRPALGPTQPPVKWSPVLSLGKVRPGRAADHSPPSSAAVMAQ